jgi:hypothetical protein
MPLTPDWMDRVVFVPHAPHYCHLEPWRNAAGRLVPVGELKETGRKFNRGEAYRVLMKRVKGE